MNFETYKHLILSDLYRIVGKTSKLLLLKFILLRNDYKFCFWMRTCAYTHNKKLLRYTIYPLAKFFYSHFTYKLGISIPFSTKINSGLTITHFGGIVVNHHAVIGKNCNISQGVTLGEANRGPKKGFPTIGDNVYFGPGAKIIGAVKIGNNVAVGANCVVTKDVPDNAVIVGIPGKVISQEGSAGYVIRTDYMDL